MMIITSKVWAATRQLWVLAKLWLRTACRMAHVPGEEGCCSIGALPIKGDVQRSVTFATFLQVNEDCPKLG